MVNVPFEDKEVAATLHLLDLAQKAGGLQVSEACAALVRKFREAMQVAQSLPDDTPADSVGSSGRGDDPGTVPIAQTDY